MSTTFMCFCVILGCFLLLFDVILVPLGIILGPWWPLGSQRGPRLPKVRCWLHFGLLLGALGEHFWGHFGQQIRNRRDYVDFLVPFFWSRKKEQKRSSPGGGDMRSAHAGACFVRVGRCRVGSILGSILEPFWELRSVLYSFWAARVGNRPPK